MLTKLCFAWYDEKLRDLVWSATSRDLPYEVEEWNKQVRKHTKPIYLSRSNAWSWDVSKSGSGSLRWSRFMSMSMSGSWCLCWSGSRAWSFWSNRWNECKKLLDQCLSLGFGLGLGLSLGLGVGLGLILGLGLGVGLGLGLGLGNVDETNAKIFWDNGTNV